MTRILSDVPELLAVILEAEGGSIDVTELLDREGIHLTYDVSSLVRAATYVVATRTFDQSGITQGSDFSSDIVGLPPLFQVLGINVATDDSSRLSNVLVNAQLDRAVSSGAQSDPLWRWDAADPTWTINNSQGADFKIGVLGIGNEVLEPPVRQRYLEQRSVMIGWPFAPLATNRRGLTALRISGQSAAFGAGTVKIAVQLVLGFNLKKGQKTSIYQIPIGS